MVTAVSAMERGMRAWLDGLRSELDEKSPASLRERVEQRLGKAQAVMQELERVGGLSNRRKPSKSGDLAGFGAGRRGRRRSTGSAPGHPAGNGAAEELAHHPIPRPSRWRSGPCSTTRLLATSRGQSRPRGARRRAAAVLRVVDGGPGVPDAAQTDLLYRRVDPTALGRPDGISLLAATLCASRLGAQLSIGSDAGRTAFVLSL